MAAPQYPANQSQGVYRLNIPNAPKWEVIEQPLHERIIKEITNNPLERVDKRNWREPIKQFTTSSKTQTTSVSLAFETTQDIYHPTTQGWTLLYPKGSIVNPLDSNIAKPSQHIFIYSTESTKQRQMATAIQNACGHKIMLTQTHGEIKPNSFHYNNNLNTIVDINKIPTLIYTKQSTNNLLVTTFSINETTQTIKTTACN